MATWSEDTTSGVTEEARRDRMLAHAANIMGSPRVLFVWEDDEEPLLRIALWDGSTTLSGAASDEFSPLVRADLKEAIFLSPDVRAELEVVTILDGDDESRGRPGAPIHRAFADRFDMGPVISAPVSVVGTWGRLFFLDKPNPSLDDLMLASVVAAGIGMMMEESRLQARLRESAAYEERVRLAADLHDGVLQSLTGTALQLETARRLLERDFPAAQDLIQSVQQSLATEQRDLRLFVDQLKPRDTMERAVAPDLPARLQELSASISRQWGLEVETVLEDPSIPGIVTDDLAADVYLIVREGLINSARHAHATQARATIRSKTETLEVLIEDNGTGFPFRGRHDLASLRAMGTGPVALMQRVAARGGTLVVDSGVAGSRVEIDLPLDKP